MNKITYLKLECPKCHSPVQAKVNKRVYKFLIYRCPTCESNVVYYDDQVDILSDELVKSLTRNKNFDFFGDAPSSKVFSSNERIGSDGITKDHIINLRILLNKEEDVKDFLTRI